MLVHVLVYVVGEVVVLVALRKLGSIRGVKSLTFVCEFA
jgi:hypothetical protein